MQNSAIVAVLESLRKKRELMGEGFRAKAYEKAIEQLKNSPPILSKAQALTIKGIGKSIAEKIEEILTTGTCKELSEETVIDKEKEKVLALFMSLERVGPKTAEDWYRKGYRCLKDIPLESCTAAQQIGIALYDELRQRIPRSEIDYVKTLLETSLTPYGIKFEIAGSYRRGLPDSGDIDVLVQGTDVRILDYISSLSLFTHILAKGAKKLMGICRVDKVHRRIDVELTPPQEWIPALIYFTGSQNFNIGMRGYCVARGLRLNEKGLYDKAGNCYTAHSEEHFFSMLRLEYIPPEKRSDPKYWKFD